MRASEVVLDGELVVEDGEGHNPSTSSGHSFKALQSRVHSMNELAVRVAAQTFPATLMVYYENNRWDGRWGALVSRVYYACSPTARWQQTVVPRDTSV